jgi:methylmalonyl-CoA/ethylmalonyl-CoA epimerase
MELLQVAQHANDLARATTFYRSLLGDPIAHFEPPGLVFFQLGGVRLLLDRAAPSALLYLRVADVVATTERLRGLGVTIDSEPHPIFRHEDDRLGPAGTTEWHAFVRDTEDNLIGLVSHAQ